MIYSLKKRFGKRSKLGFDEDSFIEQEQVATKNKALQGLRDLFLRKDG
jgi:hypothetical protein